MQISIKLADFAVDSHNEATVIVTAPVDKFSIEFFFSEGDDWNEHKIVIAGGSSLHLPHYVQALVVYEAAKMIDSHFDNDAEPYDEKTIDA